MAHEVQADGRVHGVVFGIRREDGAYLMIRRGRGVALPLKVCFPGGGANVGETYEAAAIREGREELGIEIEPVKVVWTYHFPDKALSLFGLLARWVGGELTPDATEVEEVLWLTPAMAMALPDGLPTNEAFIKALETAWNSIASG